MWLNGVERTPLSDTQGQGGSAQLDPTFWIGAGSGPAHGWNGWLAHVSVYNSWLSQARITAHYEEGVYPETTYFSRRRMVGGRV